MRILKPISVALIATLTLASCGTTKTATSTTTATAAVKEITIITATDSISPKTGKMTEAQIQAWPHMDVFTDSVPGMSLDKAYAFVKDKQSTTVIVAVIDSGIDIEHEDLKDVVWVNTNEIAGNNKDDDNNGYVDDINGWNFLGGKAGQSTPEQLELTRIVKKMMPRFDGKAAEDIAEADKADFKLFTELKSTIDKKLITAKNTVEQYTSYRDAITMVSDTLTKILVGKEMNLENINATKFDDPALQQGKMILMQVVSSGDTADDAKKELKGAIDHFSNQLNSQYKIDFNGRLTNDNPDDITDTSYGNGLVIGSKGVESHGTHVSGIIAAKRNNGIGMDGVAHNVKIMAIRAVPDGDEYDKDVALAIRYAADNGAKVVNMSFGKGHSPNAEWVYDAIKYAAEKDVLLVHAAGNSSENIDTAENFPNDSKDKLAEFSDNVLTIGAMSLHFDDNISATFSNYGKINVDVFAPGVDIYSTLPNNDYGPNSGTSMASPEVAGVAALIRSYYPKLTASQVKHIIMDSGIEYKKDIIKPGTKDEKVSFDSLSVSGRILNAYNALVLADKMSKK